MLPTIQVSQRGSVRIAELAKKTGGDESTLVRIAVSGVTPASFHYRLRFCRSSQDADILLEGPGLPIVTDAANAEIVDGVELAYIDGMAILRQANCIREPQLDPELGVLATLSVHRLSDEALWEQESEHARASPQETGSYQIQTPVAPPSSEYSHAAQVTLDLLDPQSGLQCIPKFWKNSLTNIVRRESDAFHTQYQTSSLQILSDCIEPLADDKDEAVVQEFADICHELYNATNLTYIGRRFGFDPPDSNDPVLWLKWAEMTVAKPERSLYCLAGFIAVPPILDEVPIGVMSQLAFVTGSRLAEIRRPTHAARTIEYFYSLAPADFHSPQTLADRLNETELIQLPQEQRHQIAALFERVLRESQRSQHADNFRAALGFVPT